MALDSGWIRISITEDQDHGSVDYDYASLFELHLPYRFVDCAFSLFIAPRHSVIAQYGTGTAIWCVYLQPKTCRGGGALTALCH